jgi:nucleotide-binding universal stress UspA family protein
VGDDAEVSDQQHVNGAGRVVLVCYDGSDDARAAIEAVADVAAGHRVVVACFWQGLANVANRYAMSLLDIIQDPASINEREQARAIRVAEDGADIARALGLSVEARAPEAQGGLDDAINEFADEIDAHLVVIGSRGRSSVSSGLLGDVSHDVVQRARRPVLVVPGRALAERRR